MKKTILLFLCLGAVVFAGGCKATEMTSVPNGFIRSADLALEIGKIYLNHVYGADKVTEQEPFEAILEDDRWIVSGKSNPYAEEMRIVLQRSSGKVVSVAPVIDYSKPQR